MARFVRLTALIFSIMLCLTTSAAGTASDTLDSGSNMTDGATLVSAGGFFTLGFFSPTGVPDKRYLGIWFTASPDAVCWVANRETFLSNTSGVLVIGSTGSLRLLDGSGLAAWSSHTTSSPSAPPVVAQAKLLQSGNLVVRDKSGRGDVLWQSFDHPSNTLLAGMRFGKNPKTGAEWLLTSWRASNDPAPGDFHRALDTRGLLDSVSWQGNVKKYRTGPWNGLWFSGIPETASYMDTHMYSVEVVVRPDEVAYIFNAAAGAPFCRLVLNEVGVVQQLGWDPASRAWNVFTQAPRDVCDGYAKCGAFGVCNVNTASTLFCGCVVGFSPVNPSQWSMRESGGGCRRNVPLECGNGTTTDGFRMVREVKLPDTDNATVDMGATLEQCRARCLANCSCVAYAAADIRGGGAGSGCVMWTDALMDVRYVDKGQDIYLRLAKSELVEKKRNLVIVIVPPLTACLLALVGIFLVWIWRRRKLRGKRGNMDGSNRLGDEDLDLPFFSFGDIVSATNNFAEGNMLGQGGFGKVYKGILGENSEVAIKRLSQGSAQGIDEFRNEVVLIAKLQHRNLVRLLGCCIDRDEKLLIYEYLPNKSLDSFIFDAARKKVLDWPTRFRIIKGISRGVLYLHEDSRLTIVHRDLKTSNILLDADMNPKISDFGMARIFGGDQQESANTNKVVGTYGYMPPEYAMDGAFSVMSDTYSLGVILLEIISGLKINSTQSAGFRNLIAYAWSLWNDGNAMDLVDPSVLDSCSENEALRCIHIGLLCVQDNPNSRPLMSTVVFMLENETELLSTPKQPLYISQWYLEAQGTGENTSGSMMNNISVPELEGR